MTKRIQIVARIDPALRRVVARAVKGNKTTLNALVEDALTQYVAGARPAKSKARSAAVGDAKAPQ